MAGAQLILTVDPGNGAKSKNIVLEVSCPPQALYPATNALMEEMRTRIKDAHNRELAGVEAQT